MRAIVLTGTGDVDKLEVREVPDPEPGRGEVKIKVAASSINPIDWKIRRGYTNPKFPEILGRDVAGEIVAVGPGVSRFKVGDRVLCMVRHGYAELAIAKEDNLARVPATMSVEAAAALPLVVTTGAQLIDENAEPKRGDTVLVTGAIGSVGRTAVFVAKARGARVIAGVRTDQKEEAQELGADAVVAIDDDSEIDNLPEVDEIADTVDGETIAKLLPHLKQSGRLASVLGEPDEARKRGIEVRAFMAHPDGTRLAELADAVARGDLKIPIAERRPFAEVREATRRAEQGAGGKVLLPLESGSLLGLHPTQRMRAPGSSPQSLRILNPEGFAQRGLSAV
jgi:NADPH:quinone reductase-like Zn-dependent oxidoreductase